jgi:hypothetical protein
LITFIGGVACEAQQSDIATTAALATAAVADAEQKKNDSTSEKEANAASEAVGEALKEKDPSLPAETVIDAKKEAKSAFLQATSEKLPVSTAAAVAASSGEAVASTETKTPISADTKKIAESAAMSAADGVAAHPQDGAAAVKVAEKEATDGPTQPSDVAKLTAAASGIASVAKDGIVGVAHPTAHPVTAVVMIFAFVPIVAIAFYSLHQRHKDAAYVSPYMKALYACRQGVAEEEHGMVALTTRSDYACWDQN